LIGDVGANDAAAGDDHTWRTCLRVDMCRP
jgi:hypothetical protein